MWSSGNIRGPSALSAVGSVGAPCRVSDADLPQRVFATMVAYIWGECQSNKPLATRNAAPPRKVMMKTPPKNAFEAAPEATRSDTVRSSRRALADKRGGAHQTRRRPELRNRWRALLPTRTDSRGSTETK